MSSWFRTKEIAPVYAPDSHTDLSASPRPVSRDSEWAVTGSWPGIWSMALPQPSLVTGTNCCVGIIFDSHFTLYVSLSIMLSVHLTDILWTPDTKLALRAWLLAATSNIRGNAVLFVCISLGSSRDSLEAFKNLSTFLIWMQYLFNNVDWRLDSLLYSNLANSSKGDLCSFIVVCPRNLNANS